MIDPHFDEIFLFRVFGYHRFCVELIRLANANVARKITILNFGLVKISRYLVGFFFFFPFFVTKYW